MNKTSLALAILILSSGTVHASNTDLYNSSFDAMPNADEIILAIGQSSAKYEYEVDNQEYISGSFEFDSYKMGLSHSYGNGYVTDLFAERSDYKDESPLNLNLDTFRIGFGRSFELNHFNSTTVFAKTGIYRFNFNFDGNTNDENDTGIYLESGFNLDLGNEFGLTAYARHYVDNKYLGDFQSGLNFTYSLNSSIDLFINAERLIGKFNVAANSLYIGGNFNF